jgi:CRP/FNR family transcriptional regulator, cyclic AMP receptor protein
MSGVEDAIARVPMFGHLPEKERKHLAAGFKERTFPAGKVISEAGQEGVGFFVIDSGTASVTVGGKLRRTLGSGDFFGEMALIEDWIRTATITADSELRCYGLTAWDFRPMVQTHPDVAWALLVTMARRVRELEAAAREPAPDQDGAN